ncbi:ATP-grasp domain-containing protein [Flavivirga aquimarina]|uniref:ATP-grasp domain-containing protein n=1 Tax=Flavivirga aquimarina TaxID=2027862 RepID=A0ABT8W5R2_9FLAO|nr:ATP-grasp domain-containing protein [Flavivirga aquimarina]MDO5968455.1 ATP-grasp domain-containing protein [Flavivirga aquimarina]
MRIIYCDSVFDNKVIEPDYEEEKKIAVNCGFDLSLISFEELTDGNIATALRFVKEPEDKELGIYRGWMLTPNQYRNLYDGLQKKNIKLINSPAEYKHCHYLPDSYEKIESKTPKSNWTTKLDKDSILKLTKEFGDSPIIVKDFVKSEKHNWEEACFIPNASDSSKVKTTVEKFIELRGDSLNEGLVFRQFEELEFLTDHSKSRMPLTKEFRIFFANKKIVKVFDYWDEGEYGETKPELDDFEEIAQNINSKFFTMDVAKKKDGDWIIMELGDGQVAGLPDNADKNEFYNNLKENALQQFI